MGFAVTERLVLFYLREATGTTITGFFSFHAFTSLVPCDHSRNEGAAPTVNMRPNSILASLFLRTGAYCHILSYIFSKGAITMGVSMGG